VARLASTTLAASAAGVSILGLPALYAEFRALDYLDPVARDVVHDNLADLGLSAGFYAAYLLALGVVLALACYAVAAVILWRQSRQPMALFVAVLLAMLGATFSGSIGALGDLAPFWERLNGTLNALSVTLVFLFFYLFPDGRFVPRWIRWFLFLVLVYAVPTALIPNSSASPDNWSSLPYAVLFASLLLTGVFAQVYRYRRVSDPTQRQQTKWVVFGFTSALAGYVGVISLQVAFPGLEPGTLADFLGIAAASCFMLLIPLSIAVAVLRYRLYDIDPVVNRALVYGSLTVMLALAYWGGVTATQAVFQALTGQEQQPQLAIVASTLAIAALFTPLRRRIQSFMDRRFYRRKYDARKTLEAFSAQLREETDLDALSDDLVAAVRETMHPAHAALWLRSRARKGTRAEDHEPCHWRYQARRSPVISPEGRHRDLRPLSDHSTPEPR
jgi:hypothetical protein